MLYNYGVDGFPRYDAEFRPTTNILHLLSQKVNCYMGVFVFL